MENKKQIRIVLMLPFGTQLQTAFSAKDGKPYPRPLMLVAKFIPNKASDHSDNRSPTSAETKKATGIAKLSDSPPRKTKKRATAPWWSCRSCLIAPF